MKFTVSSSALASSLQAINRVINPKSINPILLDFLFKTEDGKLVVTASDNDTTIEATVELAECDKDARVVVPSKTMLDALKEIPEQPLQFEINDTTYEITVKYMNGEYNMVGHNADEYPLPAVLATEYTTHTIDAEIFSEGISRSIFAVADDELRPVMNGIYLDFTPEGVAFVASDGHCLACDKCELYKSEEKSSFILPKRPAATIKNLIGNDVETVTLSFDNRICEVTVGDFRMVTRLIEGRYPNYNAVIPKNNPFKLTIDRQILVNALKRVSVFSPSNSGLIRMRLQEGELEISAQDLDFSTSAKETLACQYEGSPMSIGFKSGLLVEILNTIPGQEAIIQLADPSRAGIVLPAEQQEGENLLMLLMPMVLND